MDLSFLNNLRKIIDEDERIVTIRLLIDIVSNLINDRKNYRHHTLPIHYIQETFQKYVGAMQCIDLIGFKQVIFVNRIQFEIALPNTRTRFEEVTEVYSNLIAYSPCSCPQSDI